MNENCIRQPLVAKYDTQLMKYVFIFKLQIPDGTAREAWNIADTQDNNLVAVLVETANSKESPLVVLHKESGAPTHEGFKFSYPGSTTMGDIKPNRIKNLHWQDATRLWILVLPCFP